MKDARTVALQVVLARRRRLDERLNARLASERAELGELEQAQQQALDTLDEGRAKLHEQAERLKAMACGAERVAPRDYQSHVQWREVLDDRCRGFEGAWRNACAVTEQKSAQIADTMAEIRVNQTRVDVYKERIESIRKEAERAAEEAQDEEAQESRRVQAGGM